MEEFLIITTEKDSSHPDSVSQITAYGVYLGYKNEQGQWIYKKYAKERFFQEHYRPGRKYFSYNTKANDKAELYKVDNNGRPFLQTVASETKTDNLLELPDMT